MWLQVTALSSMTVVKAVTYVSLICFVILSILLSILDFHNANEFLVAKWSVCVMAGLASAEILVSDYYFFSGPRPRFSSMVVKTLAVPMLVMILASTILTILGLEKVSMDFFVRPPYLPAALIFLFAILAAAICGYESRHRRLQDKINSADSAKFFD